VQWQQKNKQTLEDSSSDKKSTVKVSSLLESVNAVLSGHYWQQMSNNM